MPNDSPWVGKLLSEIELRKQFNLLTMAVKDKPIVVNEDAPEGDGDIFQVNPPDNTIIGPSMIIITMGDVNEVRRAREAAGMRV